MKEYIESMKDSRDPFSGETYLLPEELAKKYADAEALEIEYLSSKQSGLVHLDDLALIKAEAMTAGEVYRLAITERMPTDVQAHVAFDRRAHGLENLKEPTELTIQQQGDLQRISDISLHQIENEYIPLSFHIQCRVDGRQQSAKPIYVGDHMLFSNNQISKEELAMLYFGNALHAEREHYGPELDEKKVQRYARAAYSDYQELAPWVKEMQRELDKNSDISHTVMQNGKPTQWEWMLDLHRQCIHIGHRVDNTQDTPRFETTTTVDYDISKPLAENIANISQEISRNISDRIDFLVRDFQYKEDTLEQPLYANVKIQWKDRLGSTSNRIIKLVPDRDENIVFYNADGLEELKRLTLPENGKDFTIIDVSELYGKQFNIAVADYLNKDVNIIADTEKEALNTLDKLYSNAKIVLGMKDFIRQEVIPAGSELPLHRTVKLKATPEGIYPFSVQEIIQHNEKIDARDLNEALLKMDWMLKNGQVIVGSEDDSMEVHYTAHTRLIDNSLQNPVEIPLKDTADFQEQLTRSYPEGMTVYLKNESVNHLGQIHMDKSLDGLVGFTDRALLAGHGELRAEARLAPEDYSFVFPEEESYRNEGLSGEYGTGAAATLYMYRHPDMKGGKVNLNLNPQILNRIYVENMPLSDALNTIKSRNIQSDSDFIRLRNEIKNRERITEVSLFKNSTGGTLIRCKIDGRQLSAKKLSNNDAASFLEGKLTKSDLAAKVFSKELDNEMAQIQKSGIKR